MFVSEHIPISMSHYLDYCWIYCLFSADHNCLTLSLSAATTIVQNL